MQSVIQVFYHDKMAAIGHLIASDQLPLPTQVNYSKLIEKGIIIVLQKILIAPFGVDGAQSASQRPRRYDTITF